MQYSYKSLLVYLMTVVTMTANNCSKKEPVKSIAHIYSKPKETLNEENKSNPEAEKNNNPEASPIQEVKENKEDVALEELKQRFETVWNEKVTNIPVTRGNVIDWVCEELTTEDAKYSALKRFLEKQEFIQPIVDDSNDIKDKVKNLLMELPVNELRKATNFLENEYNQDNTKDPLLIGLQNKLSELKLVWPVSTAEKATKLREETTHKHAKAMVKVIESSRLYLNTTILNTKEEHTMQEKDNTNNEKKEKTLDEKVKDYLSTRYNSDNTSDHLIIQVNSLLKMTKLSDDDKTNALSEYSKQDTLKTNSNAILYCYFYKMMKERIQNWILSLPDEDKKRLITDESNTYIPFLLMNLPTSKPNKVQGGKLTLEWIEKVDSQCNTYMGTQGIQEKLKNSTRKQIKLVINKHIDVVKNIQNQINTYQLLYKKNYFPAN